MKFFISKLYIWFDKGIKPRVITFDNNRVNVITGSSSTGKSNIYAIIDYCLLSGRPNIVFPVINENASWYGLEFNIGYKFFAIARKKPTVDVVPPELYLQNEPFYPTSYNSHVNDARRELDKAFGYKSNNELFYRSSFVFNALTVICGSFLVNCFNSEMQSGLLSSTARIPCALSNSFSMIFRPPISLSGSSIILR